jgi:thiamine pyrophosphate-dependent acetolactate synthase large subunit-like protein
LGELFGRLSGIAQPLYRVERVPLNPARAAADVGESLPDGAVVTLEPGTAGWWVARALPTTQIGSVRVPAAGRPGLAVAAAVVHALEGVRAVAVVEAPITAENTALVDLARSLGLDLVVEQWGDAGEVASPEDHRAQLAAALSSPGVHVLDVPVDFGPATEQLVAAAGPLAAWQ